LNCSECCSLIGARPRWQRMLQSELRCRIRSSSITASEGAVIKLRGEAGVRRRRRIAGRTWSIAVAAARCIAWIAARAVSVPVTLADIPHAFAWREVAGCGEIAHGHRRCWHSHGAGPRAPATILIARVLMEHLLVLLHLRWLNRDRFSGGCRPATGSVERSYTNVIGEN
jgi:hypothetical protein